MNWRPSTARALAAVLLLTALWPLGSSAGGAGRPPHAVVLPAPGTAKAAAPSDAAVVPAAFRGRWTPLSKSLASTGPLTLGARALRWSICGKARRSIEPQVADGEQQVLIALAADGAAPCKLDGQPITHLRLDRRYGNACELEATLYANARRPVEQALLAWGVFSNERCAAKQTP